MSLVSVIIPTYNRSKFVTKAVESVLAQTFTDYELIVVDDGSTDDTKASLAEYGKRLQYLPQTNQGPSAARNTGIKAATGQWIAFLDSDDEWAKEYLARQIEWAIKTPSLGMQSADCLLKGFDGGPQSYFELNGTLATLKGEDYLLLKRPFSFVIQHGPWQVGATIFRREALLQAGLFDPRLKISEDLDLMARVALQGDLGLVRAPLVSIHRRDEAIECLTGQAKKNPIQARESDELLYEKLLANKALKSAERKALLRLMSANRRAIGNLLRAAGQWSEARQNYRRAIAYDASLQSIGKYILSWLRMLTSTQTKSESNSAVGGDTR